MPLVWVLQMTVVWVDAGDVVLNGLPTQFIHAFNALDKPIVLGAEAVCRYKATQCNLWAPNPMGWPYRWVDAGVF